MLTLEEKVNLENIYYFHANHFFCGVISKWVVYDNAKCILCDRTGLDAKCYRAGREHEL